MEECIGFDENGPIVQSWDADGFVPNPVEKVSLADALEFHFKTEVLDKLPDHRLLIGSGISSLKMLNAFLRCLLYLKMARNLLATS